MKEFHVEGLATHGDPESCVGTSSRHASDSRSCGWVGAISGSRGQAAFEHSTRHKTALEWHLATWLNGQCRECHGPGKFGLCPI
jgi:hypothetical protein